MNAPFSSPFSSPDDSLRRLIIHITPVAILLIGYHWSAIRSRRTADFAECAGKK